MKIKASIRRTFASTGMVLIALALLALTINNADRQQDKVCNEVLIELGGNGAPTFMDVTDVKNILYEAVEDSLMRKRVTDLPVHSIETAFQNNPYVEDARVYIDMDNNLHIEIVQREPVARIINKYNVHYYIDENANKIPVNNKFTCRVPVISGNIEEGPDGGRVIQSKQLKKAYEIVSYMLSEDMWEAQLEQLFINQDEEVVLVPKIGNHTILLGNIYAVDIATQLDKLAVFYKEGLSYVGWDAYETINLSYSDQVVCTKKAAQ